MATYEERLAEVDILNHSDRGLSAYTDVDADIVYVKDPTHAPPPGYLAGQLGTETWVQWAGGMARSVYGF
jgi:hypothetical protein